MYKGRIQFVWVTNDGEYLDFFKNKIVRFDETLRFGDKTNFSFY